MEVVILAVVQQALEDSVRGGHRREAVEFRAAERGGTPAIVSEDVSGLPCCGVGGDPQLVPWLAAPCTTFVKAAIRSGAERNGGTGPAARTGCLASIKPAGAGERPPPAALLPG